MNEAFIKKMLRHSAFDLNDTGAEINDGYEVGVVLATQASTTISKVVSIKWNEEILNIKTNDAEFVLPCEHLFAIKVNEVENRKGGMAGFHAE